MRRSATTVLVGGQLSCCPARPSGLPVVWWTRFAEATLLILIPSSPVSEVILRFMASRRCTWVRC